MIKKASDAGIEFSFRSLYGDDVGRSRNPIFDARPELQIAPHKTYLHLTHPNRRNQYPAFRSVQDCSDPASQAELEAKCVRWLIEEAAKMDMYVPERLKAVVGGDCVLLDLATRLHDSFDLKYRVSVGPEHFR